MQNYFMKFQRLPCQILHVTLKAKTVYIICRTLQTLTVSKAPQFKLNIGPYLPGTNLGKHLEVIMIIDLSSPINHMNNG